MSEAFSRTAILIWSYSGAERQLAGRQRGARLLREIAMTGETAASTPHPTGRLAARRFGLLDAMILLAGLSLSLALGGHLLVLFADSLARFCRAALDRHTSLLDNWPAFWRAAHDDLRNTLWYAFQFLLGLLFGMTPAFFVVRLRRPRPPLRALVRQPGTVAALAILFGLFWVLGSIHYLFPDQLDAITAPGIAVGSTVAAAWCVLALSRGWESERGWIDRTGRLLGVAAVAAGLLGLLIDRI
jgi:hypothetical protein